MNTIDFVVGPLYTLLILMAGYIYTHYLPPKYRKWFLMGLTAKVAATLLFVLLYTVYYSGGDTVSYFNTGNVIAEAFKEDFQKGIKLFFSSTYDYTGSNLYYKSLTQYFSSPSSFLNAKISSIFSLISFGSFWGASLFYGLIAFFGSWSLYRKISQIYPGHERGLGILILMIPSVVLWSSGIMKDSLVFGLLCWSFVLAYKILLQGKFSNLLPLIVVLYYMTFLKAYVTTAFLPAAIFMAYVKYSSAIKSIVLKTAIQPVLLLILLGVGFKATQLAGNYNKKFALDNIIERVEITQDYIYRTSIIGAKLQNRTGSKYELPRITGSMSDLKLVPLSINVTLFRPYFFEVRNPIMLLASFESTLFLVATLLVFFKLGLFRSLSTVLNDPFLTFCLIFSIGFSIAIGISTFNFGTLARYKIPILPFYASMLYILYTKPKITRGRKLTANFS